MVNEIISMNGKNFVESKRKIKVEIGDIIEIVSMKGEPQYNGKKGEVIYIDSIGQIQGTWGGCALIPNIDTFVVIKKQ